MTDPNTINNILEGLIQRTTDDRLQWSATVKDDRFIASIQAISVAIEEQYSGAYRLEILDEGGRLVEILDRDNATQAQERMLEQIYVQARRSAIGGQRTLEKLAAALNLGL